EEQQGLVLNGRHTKHADWTARVFGEPGRRFVTAMIQLRARDRSRMHVGLEVLDAGKRGLQLCPRQIRAGTLESFDQDLGAADAEQVVHRKPIAWEFRLDQLAPL